MDSLGDLSEQLRDGGPEGERAIVDAVSGAVRKSRAPLPVHVDGEWSDPYLTLRFGCENGTVIEVMTGDGYTRITGGGVEYEGYIESSALAELLRAAIDRGVTYVRRSRLGCNVADYFEVEGQASRVGDYGRGILGVGPYLLRLIPGLPESTQRIRINL